MKVGRGSGEVDKGTEESGGISVSSSDEDGRLARQAISPRHSRLRVRLRWVNQLDGLASGRLLNRHCGESVSGFRYR